MFSLSGGACDVAGVYLNISKATEMTSYTQVLNVSTLILMTCFAII